MKRGHHKIAGKALLMAIFGVFVFSMQPVSALAKGKRITLEELVIEGNIQKPEAFFILPRAALST